MMRYFISENQRKAKGSTCYFEFQTGQKNKRYVPVYWKEDSLLLHMDLMEDSELWRLIPDFDYYGFTLIDPKKWNVIQSNAETANDMVKGIISELSDWVKMNFKEYEYFVICGI